eukprot:5639492-Karenia_brevis.AAC.1
MKAMIDVRIRTPHAESYANPHIEPGVAAHGGEIAKRSRYGPDVQPLSFETYGRLGVESAEALRNLALSST